MSSVPGLNATPSSATVAPERSRCFFSFPMTRRFCSSLTSMTAVRSWKWYPELPASCLRAETSLGKQLPPKPMPALRNDRPMRGSWPMPSATVTTSAPTSSQTLAISLMKVILVARKALDAYLIISAVATSVRMTGASIGA